MRFSTSVAFKKKQKQARKHRHQQEEEAKEEEEEKRRDQQEGGEMKHGGKSDEIRCCGSGEDVYGEDGTTLMTSPGKDDKRGGSVISSSTAKAKECIQNFRTICGSIVNHDKVQFLIVLIIAVNAVMMGIATLDFVSEDPQMESIFEGIDQFFLVVFTIELMFQLVYLGHRLFMDGWLVFDFVIILVSWSFAGLQIIRAFRIFRALRLITRVQVMKNLVMAVFSVMPRMVAICLLMFLIDYIFAVMFTQLFKDLHLRHLTSDNYFGRLDTTFFTLFQMMTLDSWGKIASEVIEVYEWAWVPFLFFVTISGFVVVNLIVAVICDAVKALNDGMRAKIMGIDEEDDDDDEEEEDDDRNDTLSNLGSTDMTYQLRKLEIQVHQLTELQERTVLALNYLAEQIEEQELTADDTIDDSSWTIEEGDESEDDV